ncbi:MAG: hypothetical protein Q9166_000002 [cf. Caloplaca sp. 2 TL-2023]
MVAQKSSRDPSMYQFKEPTGGYIWGGQRATIQQIQEQQPKYKDGHNPDMCTAIQRVSWLNGALKAAHDRVDELQTTVENLEEKIEQLTDESDRNEVLEGTMARLELDKKQLQGLVDADARSKDLHAQLDKERMSALRVSELEAQLVRMREEHLTTINDLTKAQEAVTIKLVSEHDLTKATLRAELEKLVSEHEMIKANSKKELENLALRHRLELKEQQCVHQEEIMKMREEQTSHLHFQGTYRPSTAQEPSNAMSTLARNVRRFTEES